MPNTEDMKSVLLLLVLKLMSTVILASNLDDDADTNAKIKGRKLL